MIGRQDQPRSVAVAILDALEATYAERERQQAPINRTVLELGRCWECGFTRGHAENYDVGRWAR